MSLATAAPVVALVTPVALSVTKPIGWVMTGGAPGLPLTAKMAASFPPVVLVMTRLMVLIAPPLLATGIIASNKRTPGVLGLSEPPELRGSREKGCGPMPMRFGGRNALANWSGVLLTDLTLGAIRPKQT